MCEEITAATQEIVIVVVVGAVLKIARVILAATSQAFFCPFHWMEGLVLSPLINLEERIGYPAQPGLICPSVPVTTSQQRRTTHLRVCRSLKIYSLKLIQKIL